jgi:DNA-binding GntR family transcriptional regulator
MRSGNIAVKRATAKIDRFPKRSSTSVKERAPLAEQAYREIKRRILDNEFSPGTTILEQELALLLRMSRTPVREAAVRLAEEGLVEVRPRHGMGVLSISADDMLHIYEILAALESEAAGLIAEAGLSSDNIAALKQSVTDMDDALAADDLLSWAAADERFHGRLIDNCPNSRLHHLVYQFWDQAHRVRMMTLRLRPKPVTSNRDHRSLIKAIERREPERAREVHRRHLLRSGKMLVELLQTHGFKAL